MHRVFQWTVTLLLAVAPQGASAATLISEVFYDAVGSDNGLSFVELYGAPGSSLDGLFLEGINGSNGAAGPTMEQWWDFWTKDSGQFWSKAVPGISASPGLRRALFE